MQLPIPGKMASVATLRVWKTLKTVRGRTEVFGIVSRQAIASREGTGLALATRPSARTRIEEKNTILEVRCWVLGVDVSK